MANAYIWEEGVAETMIAAQRAKKLAVYAVYALGIMAGGNAVGVGMILYRLPAGGLETLADDLAGQVILLRMSCWTAIALVAIICAVFVMWRQSRIAILIGFCLLAFDWADWAFGFLGRARFTLFGLVAQVGSTLMLTIGFLGAYQYHRLRKALGPQYRKANP